MITQSEAPAPEEIEVQKYRRELSSLSAATVEIGLTGRTRASLTPEKRIPAKKKYKITSFVSINKGSNYKSG